VARVIYSRFGGEHRAGLRASRLSASPAFTPKTLCSPTRRRAPYRPANSRWRRKRLPN